MRTSRRVLSTVVLSFFHQKTGLVLKSPRVIVNREMDDAVVFEMSSKFGKSLSNFSAFCLGDL